MSQDYEVWGTKQIWVQHDWASGNGESNVTAMRNVHRDKCSLQQLSIARGLLCSLSNQTWNDWKRRWARMARDEEWLEALRMIWERKGAY